MVAALVYQIVAFDFPSGQQEHVPNTGYLPEAVEAAEEVPCAFPCLHIVLPDVAAGTTQLIFASFTHPDAFSLPIERGKSPSSILSSTMFPKAYMPSDAVTTRNSALFLICSSSSSFLL